jgi:hypothetical protein
MIAPQESTWVREAKALTSVEAVAAFVQKIVDAKVNTTAVYIEINTIFNELGNNPGTIQYQIFRKILSLLGGEDGSGTGLSVYEEAQVWLSEGMTGK